MTQPLGLYIHIPFCKSRCTYCDFNAYAGLDQLRDSYTAGLVAELRAWGRQLGRPVVQTVFFGGGTPTRLDVDHFEAIFTALHEAFDVLPDAELTSEANPATVTEPQIRALRALGLNRLSLGIQSFDDRLLAPLRRAHSADDAVEAYELARRAGFDNVNLDLIYALPEQRFADWADTLDRAISLRPEHLSMYCLTIEEGTPLSAAVRGGSVPPPDPDLAADMYEHAEATMVTAGYQQYEISNWARPGYECRHNLVYWRNQPYLGVGAGAHSHLGTQRFANIRPPGRYATRALEAGDGHHRATAPDAGLLVRAPESVVAETETTSNNVGVPVVVCWLLVRGPWLRERMQQVRRRAKPIILNHEPRTRDLGLRTTDREPIRVFRFRGWSTSLRRWREIWSLPRRSCWVCDSTMESTWML